MASQEGEKGDCDGFQVGILTSKVSREQGHCRSVHEGKENPKGALLWLL